MKIKGYGHSTNKHKNQTQNKICKQNNFKFKNNKRLYKFNNNTNKNQLKCRQINKFKKV